MNGAMLEIADLHVSYGQVDAVRGVSLSLAHGQIVSVIGPNGAGKTTLINLLTGVFMPTRGTIHMGDRELTSLSADKRARMGLARTFQINTLFPSLTPLLSVVLAISEREGLGAIWWRPLTRNKALFDEAHTLLGRLKLDALADVPVAELAYGKQRLLEIALAMAARPRILLLDEPAAGVPSGETGLVIGAIERLPPDVALLIIDHDMDLVFRVARVITVMVAGRILVAGEPAAIAGDPQVRQVYLGDRAAR